MSRLTVRHAWAETGLLLGTAAIVYLIDRITKAWIEGSLAVGESVSVLGDLVMLWRTDNEGAAFGLLQGGQLLFIAVGIGTVVAVSWVHLTNRLRGTLPTLLLGLILGGTVGNLIDRIADGSVTDFISVGIGSLRWPSFNVADASMFVGIVSLVILLSVLDRRAAASAA